MEYGYEKKEIDILLLIAIITISIFGVIMVYSSSYVWQNINLMILLNL